MNTTIFVRTLKCKGWLAIWRVVDGLAVEKIDCSPCYEFDLPFTSDDSDLAPSEVCKRWTDEGEPLLGGFARMSGAHLLEDPTLKLFRHVLVEFSESGNDEYTPVLVRIPQAPTFHSQIWQRAQREGARSASETAASKWGGGQGHWQTVQII